MKEESHIFVVRGPQMPHGPWLEEKAFSECWALAWKLGMTKDDPSGPRSSFGVATDPSSPELHAFMEKLKTYGWSPVFGYVCAGSTDRYGIRTVRTYDFADLEDCPHLSATCFQCLLSPEGRHPDEQGWTANAITLDYDPEVESDPRVTSIASFNYFVRADVKERLQGLAGLEFRPLRWSEQTKYAIGGEYWELQTKNRMPRCLLPVVWMDDHFNFEEGGHVPPELHYRRSEVESLPVFDVAWSAEEIGSPEKSYWGRRIMVFSQRFGQILLAEGIDLSRAVNFTPVRLYG